MDTGKQILEQEKREAKSKDVDIVFVQISGSIGQYNVLDEDKSIKYIGKVRLDGTQGTDEFCTCPDQFHRNTQAYQDEHGYSLQCKHMLKAKKRFEEIKQRLENVKTHSHTEKLSEGN